MILVSVTAKFSNQGFLIGFEFTGIVPSLQLTCYDKRWWRRYFLADSATRYPTLADYALSKPATNGNKKKKSGVAELVFGDQGY
jgi:hypothetical protein